MSETITSTGEIGSTLPVETAPRPDVQAAPDEANPQPADTDASEADPSTADDVPEPDAEDAGAEPDEPKKAKGVQKRIDELTEARRRAEREADWLREQLGRAQSQPQQNPQEQQGKPAQLHPDLAQAVGQPPKPDDFPAGEFDPAYIKASLRFETRQEQAQLVMQQRENARRYAEQQTAATFAQQAEQARSKYADFDAVALNPSLSLTQVMGQVIAESEHGADIAYYLGKNPAEAARIAALTPVKAAREIGRIEARLEARPAPSAAPSPPSSTLKGAGSTALKNVENMSMAEYRQARESGRLK